MDGPDGQVAEWSKAPHSKCGVRATVPGVRIPPCPPILKWPREGPFEYWRTRRVMNPCSTRSRNAILGAERSEAIRGRQPEDENALKRVFAIPPFEAARPTPVDGSRFQESPVEQPSTRHATTRLGLGLEPRRAARLEGARNPRNHPTLVTLTLDLPRPCACFEKVRRAQGCRQGLRVHLVPPMRGG